MMDEKADKNHLENLITRRFRECTDILRREQ